MLMLVNGCSHTEGGEIIKPEPGGWPKTSKQRAWGAHLSKKLGFDYLNIALSGASNYKIKTNTQNWIIENAFKKNKVKSEDLFVCIMWSGWDRFELYNKHENMSESATTYWLEILKNKSLPEHGNWWKDYSREYKLNLKKFLESLLLLEDNLTYKYNSLSTVYDMMLFLENYNIKYFFINGIHSFDRLMAMNKDHYFYNNIDNLYFNMGNRIDKYYAFYNKQVDADLLEIHDKRNKEKDEDVQKFIDKYGTKYKNSLDNLYNIDSQYTYFDYFKLFLNLPIPKWSETHHWGEEAHKIWADNLYDFIMQRKVIL